MMLRTWTCCLALLVAPLSAQSEARVIRQLKSALGDPSSALEDRLKAVEAAAKFDTQKSVDALVRAYTDLEAQAREPKEKRAKYLGRGGGSAVLRMLRYEL